MANCILSWTLTSSSMLFLLTLLLSSAHEVTTALDNAIDWIISWWRYIWFTSFLVLCFFTMTISSVNSREQSSPTPFYLAFLYSVCQFTLSGCYHLLHRNVAKFLTKVFINTPLALSMNYWPTEHHTYLQHMAYERNASQLAQFGPLFKYGRDWDFAECRRRTGTECVHRTKLLPCGCTFCSRNLKIYEKKQRRSRLESAFFVSNFYRCIRCAWPYLAKQKWWYDRSKGKQLRQDLVKGFVRLQEDDHSMQLPLYMDGVINKFYGHQYSSTSAQGTTQPLRTKPRRFGIS